MNALEVFNVSKIYGAGATQVTSVDNVSLSLNAGEILLIMGPSGSGKTTLLSIMGCILRPTQGRVTLAGQCITDLKEKQLPDIRRNKLGFIFQAFNLFPTLTTVENVELVFRLKGYSGKESTARSLALLNRVGLGKRVNLYPKDLSGGEKQRTAFARALAGNPPVILADEPTANLDSKTGRDLLLLLRHLAEEENKAVAIVSHDPKAVELAHRVVELQDGRIIS